MRGEDAEGNTIVAKSQRFLVGPITIAITWDQTPNALDFGEGKTVQFVFTTRYGVGQVMDETYGRPSATMLFNNQPVTPRPEVEFVGGQWVATWAAPPVLPAGTYILAVGGNDASGNVIANARSTPFILGEGSLTTSFLKTVPGPTPLLMLAVLFAVALVLARRRRA
jgi:uncharacterized protein (TIGR03382 family)